MWVLKQREWERERMNSEHLNKLYSFDREEGKKGLLKDVSDARRPGAPQTCLFVPGNRQWKTQHTDHGDQTMVAQHWEEPLLYQGMRGKPVPVAMFTPTVRLGRCVQTGTGQQWRRDMRDRQRERDLDINVQDTYYTLYMAWFYLFF